MLNFDSKGFKGNGVLIGRDFEFSVRFIDILAMAIRYGLKILDLTTLRCAGQPELSFDPGKEPIVLAVESAFEELYNK